MTKFKKYSENNPKLITQAFCERFYQHVDSRFRVISNFDPTALFLPWRLLFRCEDGGMCEFYFGTKCAIFTNAPWAVTDSYYNKMMLTGNESFEDVLGFFNHCIGDL